MPYRYPALRNELLSLVDHEASSMWGDSPIPTSPLQYITGSRVFCLLQDSFTMKGKLPSPTISFIFHSYSSPAPPREAHPMARQISRLFRLRYSYGCPYVWICCHVPPYL